MPMTLDDIGEWLLHLSARGQDDITFLLCVPYAERKTLPRDQYGLYVVCDLWRTVLYVGMTTTSFWQRWNEGMGHHMRDWLDEEVRHGVDLYIHYMPCVAPDMVLRWMELTWIALLKPAYNAESNPGSKARRAQRLRHLDLRIT